MGPQKMGPLVPVGKLQPTKPGAVPSVQRGGYNHGGRNPASNAALARAIASQDPINREIYAQRQALMGAPALGFDWGSVEPPTSAQSIDEIGRAVILPVNATAQMITTATELYKAMANPAGVATSADSLTDIVTNITGSGEVAGVDIPAGYIAVIDEFGVDSWSLQAEYEIEWAIGTQAVTGVSGGLQLSRVVANPQRGWRQGSIDRPAKVKGYRVIAASSVAIRLSVIAFHTGQASPALTYYVPAPHYVECCLRGWLIPSDPTTGEPIGQKISNQPGAGVGAGLMPGMVQ